MGGFTRSWVLRLAAATLAGVGLSAQPLLGQTGGIEGRVTDAASQQPVVGAEVSVEGGGLRAVTDAAGRFQLTGVPAAFQRIQVRAIGYKMQALGLTVADGRTATADFALTRFVVSLEGLVVTATGEERRREVGNVIATVDAGAVEEGAINTVTELLTARAAGVQILPSSGTSGMGSRIRIRGANSVSLANDPIVYVDGVRISSENGPLSFETGGDSPNRLNDIDPNSIASIEVVKGPAAATLYGTDAANGVIWITTRRGRAGATRFNVYSEGGALSDPYQYPASYRGRAANGSPCRLFDVAAGLCTQVALDSLSPLENPALTPFRTGSLWQVGANVAGGSELARYFLAADVRDESGVLAQSDLRRWNLRGNVDASLSPTLDVTLSTGYTTSNLGFPLNGNYELGILGNGLASQGTTEILGGYGFFPQSALLNVDSRQRVDRFTGSLQASWTPARFWSARLTVGLDQINRRDEQFFPTGDAPAWLGYENGALFANRFQTSTYTVDFLSSARARLAENVSSETAAGVQYIRDLTSGTLASGLQLVAGTRSITAAAVTSSSSQTVENAKVGVFVQQKVGFNDRLFLTGAVRADDASAFGSNFNAILYPKFSASWVVADRPWGPFSTARLRGAFGESGLQPGPTDALRFFNPVPVTVDGQSTTGVTFGGLGNTNLKPERSREVEVGFDAEAWDGRLGLEFTYYNKQTRDALVFRQLPPSLGLGQGRFENLGSVRNSGAEMLVTAQLLTRETLDWRVTLNGALLSNSLRSLGAGIPPIILSGNQRHVVGFPLGGYWDFPILGFSDANGDGIIAASEVTIGDTEVYLGSPFPTRQLSVRNDLQVGRWIKLGALLDYRGGNRLYNNTAAWRDLQNITRALNDPSTPLADQARAQASKFLGTDAGYVENAAFLKLRELSVSFYAPERLARMFRSQGMSFVLAGRNLATWTDYTGPDPEVNQIGQANFLTRDFMGQAPVRYFTARLNLTF
jgi:TonB-linked SusC/RagA family outer membrane protein